MKAKALILAFVFLFAGSGLNIDIATCCSKISGIALSLNSDEAKSSPSCCERIVPVKKKPCCEDIAIKMVINPVLGLSKTAVYNFKVFFGSFTKPVHPVPAIHLSVQEQVISEGFDHHYPIPILKRKRVLQI